MYKIGFCYLWICVLCAGCIAPPNPTPEAVVFTPTLLEGHYDHFSPRWEVASQPSLKEGDLSIVVYGIDVAGYGTILIYSAAGSAVDELIKPGTIIQIWDDQDRISELVSIDSAATIKNLQLGVMRFKPRQMGAKELYLHVSRGSDKKDLVDMTVAWFVNPPEDPRHKGASYVVSTTQVFEQAGHRISFVGWIPPQLSIPPTPFSPSEHATLRIEELNGNRVYQLHIRLLSNGEIMSELNEYIQLPTNTPQ